MNLKSLLEELNSAQEKLISARDKAFELKARLQCTSVGSEEYRSFKKKLDDLNLAYLKEDMKRKLERYELEAFKLFKCSRGQGGTQERSDE
jgi:hypothetical protein